ncbi:hypothetical protein [Flavivirga jejuensis]|uniref:Uncharacterized protein n=1 Tax=Flavivirga jejuensis TaxID=870487 RepID=A0ABT8WLG6_9FLAO|nr:hypothetical protein [Flavivirga jejuensis]MDO5973997.1 hypothetical protein [Flavivirga jejuensis]
MITNLKNLAESGESYYYMFFKLKQVIDQNESIKVVFVEYSNNQINENMNKWIWAEKYINFRYPQYSSFMNISDKLILARNNPTGYLNSFSLALKKKTYSILKQDFDYSNKIGGYLYLERDKTDSLVNSITSKKTPLNKLSISEYNLDYLSRILQYCEAKRKKVILIRSPMHKKYSGYSNELFYNKIRNEKYPNIEYLDFSKFPLTNSEFGDLEHLNFKGAKVFSKWFSDILNNGLLDKTDKQAFINDEIQARMHSNDVYKK